jgi:hypothetical protein
MPKTKEPVEAPADAENKLSEASSRKNGWCNHQVKLQIKSFKLKARRKVIIKFTIIILAFLGVLGTLYALMKYAFDLLYLSVIFFGSFIDESGQNSTACIFRPETTLPTLKTGEKHLLFKSGDRLWTLTFPWIQNWSFPECPRVDSTSRTMGKRNAGCFIDCGSDAVHNRFVGKSRFFFLFVVFGSIPSGEVFFSCIKIVN